MSVGPLWHDNRSGYWCHCSYLHWWVNSICRQHHRQRDLMPCWHLSQNLLKLYGILELQEWQSNVPPGSLRTLQSSRDSLRLIHLANLREECDYPRKWQHFISQGCHECNWHSSLGCINPWYIWPRYGRLPARWRVEGKGLHTALWIWYHFPWPVK